MALITEAFFREGDFSRLDLIHQTFDNLNGCLTNDLGKEHAFKKKLLVNKANSTLKIISSFSTYSTIICGTFSKKTHTNLNLPKSGSFQTFSTGKKSIIFSESCFRFVYIFSDLVIFASWNVRTGTQRISLFSTFGHTS